ncbi:type 2 lanthipeptide synthetase LanM [Anaerococcus sp. AGMB09787]|uniref:type 2 lanthipeptide synthetase LanM n=1 Tax=Anaerococcus sp. AGMB09787 TaxID=2922869 RepID=UPI001FAEB42E|nr:type 2 lanthipeptide synthetase LanM [Anaerococcus sp. AGMB09787]
MNNIVKKWIDILGNINSEEELDDFLINKTGRDLDFFLRERRKLDRHLDINFNDIDNDQLRKICDWGKLYNIIYFKYRKKFLRTVHNNKYIQINKLIKDVDNYCVQELLNISYRCVIKEINRLRVQNHLVGDTSEERYYYFCNYLCSDKQYLKEFYRKYPLLKSLLELRMKQIMDYLTEICINVCRDNKEISTKFFDCEKSTLCGLDFNMGDAHNNGKFVCLLEFENNKKLIYKPRSMSIDSKLIDLSKFISLKSNGAINIYVPDVITKCDYGYAEFIQENSCKSNLQIKKYYKNMGYIMGLLYFLQSKDYHGENIINSGDKPYLIDNETILHKIDSSVLYKNCTEFIYNKINNSVFSTGLLPYSIYSSKNNLSMEVGALNSGKIRKSPFKTQEIVNKKTDKIKIISVFKNLMTFPSSPKINEKSVSCEMYLRDIEDGFIEFFKFILGIKKEFIETIKKLFANEKVRYIYRNTNTYTQLLETSKHPDLLENKIDRYIYFLRLYTVTEDNNVDKAICSREIKYLLNNDIPMFYIKCNENIVYDTNENTIIKDKNSTIIKSLVQNISQIDLNDMEYQLKIINMSFLGNNMTKGMAKTNLVIDNLKISEIIVQRILKNSFTYNNETGWQSLINMGNGQYNIAPIDFSLYQGTSGIMLILAKSGLLNKDTLKRIINYTISNYKLINFDKFGAFDGKFGILYSLANIYNMNIGYRDELKKIILDELIGIFSNEKLTNLKNDIISGYAGILGVLLTINDIFRNDVKIKDLSYRMSDYILNIILESKIDKTDIGYAHGNAGIIVQLYRYLKYYNINNSLKLKIKNKISKLESVERISNGRYEIRKDAKYYSWCNGVFGLLLKNKYINKNYVIPYYIKNDLLNNGFGEDFSICHGDIGNISILNYICNLSKCYRNKMVDKSINKLFSFKKNNDYDDRGLMTGETGILAYYNDNGYDDIVRILCLEKLRVNNEK